ncbi:MAG: ABC transporter permease [Anaerolineae bacterium]|nr:ABC transporter permease [Anaerolineae bacterium]
MTAVTAPARERSFDWRTFFQRYGLLLSFALLCLGLTLASDRFLTADNLLNVLRQSTINGIISVGMMLVILTRGIDLSVGSMLALATVMAADVLQQGWPPLPALLFCLVVGGLLGLVNGLVVSWVRIPPFIATLGMMTFARGLALLYTGGQPITGLDDGFRQIGTGSVGPIPMPILVAGAVFLGGYVLLEHTPLGRHIFALGDNERTARLTGLPTRRLTTFVYVAAGALSALAGAILIARLNSAQPTAGESFEFDAIAAVVVGGTSFEGGEGTLLGTLIGVLIIAVLNNGLNLLDVPADYQGVVKGVVIALALLLHRAIR